MGAAQARLSLHVSKCHIVGNHMSRLIWMKRFAATFFNPRMVDRSVSLRLISSFSDSFEFVCSYRLYIFGSLNF